MTWLRSPSHVLSALVANGASIAVDLGVMALAGLFFAAIGPFDTSTVPTGPRTAYWIVVMTAGGLVVLGVEAVIARIWTVKSRALRLIAVTVAATPLQTGVVVTCGSLIFGYRRPSAEAYFELVPAVLVVTLVAVAVIELVRVTRARTASGDAAQPGASDRTGPPPPALARHLPSRLRTAPLIALQAEDHYVRVHTSAGSDLILMRFSDAVDAAAAGQPGLRLHRSWWVSEAALEAVRYKRGSGQAQLAGGLTAPVSRTYARALREAGWF